MSDPADMDSRGFVDFSANAAVYDSRHQAMGEVDFDRLWLAAGFEAGRPLIDLGAGTGRVTCGLARRGAQVIAVDRSREMLGLLRSKADGLRCSIIVADCGALPLRASSFQGAIIARLLYLTPNWREILDEASRTLMADGCLLHEWANGESDEEWVQIREKARALFQSCGITQPFHPGAKGEDEIEAHLLHLGFDRADAVDLEAPSLTTLREFLRRLVDGELSYTWAIPEQVLGECLPLLTEWAANNFDLDRTTPIPRRHSWSIYRRVVR